MVARDTGEWFLENFDNVISKLSWSVLFPFSHLIILLFLFLKIVWHCNCRLFPYVTHKAGKLEFSPNPQWQGKHFCASQRCVLCSFLFSPCIRAIIQFVHTGKEIGKQVAIDSQEEERNRGCLNVPKYNIKKSFQTPRPFHPLCKSNKVDKDMFISISIIICVRIVLHEGYQNHPSFQQNCIFSCWALIDFYFNLRSSSQGTLLGTLSFFILLDYFSFVNFDVCRQHILARDI